MQGLKNEINPPINAVKLLTFVLTSEFILPSFEEF
jgi:hypothetical protein